ncbi:hypothetical protein EON65_58270 [archaeon]|nr:MAG: hypothetical protein EON65_58270 [archaeon]
MAKFLAATTSFPSSVAFKYEHIRIKGSKGSLSILTRAILSALYALIMTKKNPELKASVRKSRGALECGDYA